MSKIDLLNPRSEKEIIIRRVFIGLLAFVNAFAVRYVYTIENTAVYYGGTNNFGCNSICLLFFGLCCILLNRFLRAEVLSNKKHIVFSFLFAYVFGATAIVGGLTLYPGGTYIFTGANIFYILFVPLGLNILFVPILSELIRYIDSLHYKGIVKEGEEKKRNGYVYFFTMWLTMFTAFLPLFIIYWPVNFIFDAAYQVRDYAFGRISTHHPILHTLLLGKCYEFGQSLGDVNKGMQIYTLCQIFILSGAFALFMHYLLKHRVKKVYRVIVFLLIILNPANHFFAVTTSKETLCAAFLIMAMVLAMDLMDGENNKLQMGIKMPLLIITSILSCQFRNNMIYAYAVGGLFIILLKKGWKNKTVICLILLVVFVGNTLTTNVLVKTTNAKKITNHKESMSLPLQCLAKVMIDHGDELSTEVYEPLNLLLPEYVLERYSLFLADGIKDNINIDIFETGLRTYLSIWARLAFKYPGIYLEQFTCLTIGYWYQLDFPYWTGGLTMLANMAMQENMEPIVNSSIIPSGIKWALKFDDTATGRLNFPIFGWLFRGAPYTWGFLFAFFYAVYAKNKRAMMLMAIPICYLATSFLGPVSWFRYLYINIAVFPMLVVWMTDKEE